MNLTVGIVGLGRMGEAVAHRLSQSNYTLYCYDPSPERQELAQKAGHIICHSIEQLIQESALIWLMVPAGKTIDTLLETIIKTSSTAKIIIDGGNSHFKDSIRRAAYLASAGHAFLDCGTSGGLKGREIGFSLMIGGEKKVYDQYRHLFDAIGALQGVMHMGPAGAGHYVKMIHNGIEYALLQAYAEGFHLLKNGSYEDLDLAGIAKTWSNGSVIRSWIVELAEELFSQDQDLTSISGAIGENSTGRWTVEEAHERGIPIDLIERSLAIRAESRLNGGNFATKTVALLRNKFGGHPVDLITKKE